jgi:hypothetical protein
MTVLWVAEKNIRKKDIDVEDSGSARIAEIDKDDSNMFVRIQSWDSLKTHDEHQKLEGKCVRVTIEILD